MQQTSFETFQDLKKFFAERLKLLSNAKTSQTTPQTLNETTFSKSDSKTTNGRHVLQQRLKDRIGAIRKKTGTDKIQKSKNQKKAATRTKRRKKDATRANKRKRKLLVKSRSDASIEFPQDKRQKKTEMEPPVPTSIVSSLIKEPSKPKRGGKGKLTEKFRKLNMAQRQKSKETEFIETGQGGDRVIQTEWERAQERAKGLKVMDDPKRLQKSIDDAFKLKARHAKQWQKRKELEIEAKQKRQQKRNANLKRRAEQRKERQKQRKGKKRI